MYMLIVILLAAGSTSMFTQRFDDPAACTASAGLIGGVLSILPDVQPVALCVPLPAAAVPPAAPSEVPAPPEPASPNAGQGRSHDDI